MLFSERKRISVREAMQTEGMDDRLRTRLWNAFYECVFCRWTDEFWSTSDSTHPSVRRVWTGFFGWAVDEIPTETEDARTGWTNTYQIMKHKFQNSEWYEVYDLIEFLLSDVPLPWGGFEFREEVSDALVRERAGYRLVQDKFVDVIEPEQITAIENAAESAAPLSGVREHISWAVAHLADRDQADFDNAIKEAISAVEGLAQLVVGDESATLGQALKVIEEHVRIHPCLKSAFEKLYGYSCDEDGLRHGSFRASEVGATEARFMLVACSAFVSYLIDKSAEAGIDLAARAAGSD